MASPHPPHLLATVKAFLPTVPEVAAAAVAAAEEEGLVAPFLLSPTLRKKER